jgi:hypothetical protein
MGLLLLPTVCLYHRDPTALVRCSAVVVVVRNMEGSFLGGRDRRSLAQVNYTMCLVLMRKCCLPVGNVLNQFDVPTSAWACGG